ncbi:CAMK protein kinase [Capronia coronata CBS 617.96]|uniref:CAMK protein kinase n=1 Tax=Capronia coronata CBS 617.96 TaxID=1182541 RepID=W9YNT2_9EURO|nr:CAMK protein kinase [Capronia coronata CBS 617.96]EXJ94223.1 CAMK protein kinase [Capronia coronata CBS 617.96]
MAQADHVQHFDRLRLKSDSEEDDLALLTEDGSFNMKRSLQKPSVHSRPSLRGSTASQDTIRATATPPMNIPAMNETSAVTDETSNPSTYIDHYMRHRNPSVSFNSEIKLDSGQSQSMAEPLEKPTKALQRGRSSKQPITDGRRSSRAHSESGRSHYDPVTGRYVGGDSQSPPRDHARIGEGRFPLLQTTVDEMARETRPNLALPTSTRSESTMSPPSEAVLTPEADDNYLLSPTTISPSAQPFSYDAPKSFRRTASQRWREGELSSSPQDFFSRAGSLRNKSLRDAAGRASRRDTSGSTRSPRSAASSYLRAFSISSGTNGDAGDHGPIACDAEGQTIGDDYVLGKQIGYGGFSTIKQVTQLQDGRQRTLAVKIVRRQIEHKSEAENEQAQAEFEHEVELWRFLNHPNVLPLEAVYKFDEATFCFIPLNTGGTLFDLVRVNRNGVPHELAKSYSYQLASALRYLHLDARVVHRDVKLENCLIEPGSNGEPGLLRLCDFGMAEWLSTDSNSGPPSPRFNHTDRPPQKHIGPADTSTSAFAGGSLEYAAPEILRVAERITDSGQAERAIVSPAVDMWAYGVCVYSMVVGSRPFQNSFQPRVVMAILAGNWNCDVLRDKAGDDVVEVVSGCLDMDESERWDAVRVMDSAWLEELAEKDHSLQHAANGWRL